ncbi:MAG: Hpt domain-containing protein, partial [Gammaproteobacteria bacterium]|nr:Hpt domain-containing protein [Gammaproteobacteria bacterium]
MPDKEDIRQQLELLRKEFASSLVGRVNQLINDLGSLTDKLNPDVSLQEIFRNLHSLSGSAGTFGFNRLSEQARQLELIVKEFSQTHTLPDKKITGQLGSGLKLLLQQVKKGPDDVRLDSPTTNRDNNERFLYVVEDDPVQGQQLCLQLQH